MSSEKPLNEKELYICCRCGWIGTRWGDCQQCPNDDLTPRSEVEQTYLNCLQLLQKFWEYDWNK
jgi:hypothetical protein